MHLPLFSPSSLAFIRRQWLRSKSSTIPDSDRFPLPRPYRPSPWQRWRTRQQLAKLDERQLKDIGLTPAQARQEIQQAFWR
ncbi:DUF1127 domain-containing protein [Salinicola halimionae]|uniref:DUF1127 domain-containing protein n=1 Tax=Salinicola halimionae TaxID=1949081 RepID=UPI000DA21470|nr:DUF1127 domain-containing protein [Salinicola halimionae]